MCVIGFCPARPAPPRLHPGEATPAWSREATIAGMSRRHHFQGRRPGVHPPRVADVGAPPLMVKTLPRAASRGSASPDALARRRAHAGERGAPAAAGSAQALPSRAPWRRRGEEERGRWWWAVEIRDPPGGAREEGGKYDFFTCRLVKLPYMCE
jgi:hypothetical protein